LVINRIYIALKAFIADRSGSILPIFAVMAVTLTVVAGAAVDYSRAIANREKMANALDAAALTVAAQLSSSVLTDDQIATSIEEAFAANLETMGLDASAISNLAYNLDSENGVIQVSTSVSVETQFIRLAGIGPENLSVGVSTEVNYSRFDVELALIVDVTGSMGGDMDTLREASEGLVDVLIPDGTEPDDSKVKISLVPYSEGVNLSTYAATVTNGESSRCVTERMGDPKYTDVAYNWDPDAAGDSFFGGGSSGCSSSSELIPLTADRDTLIPAIEDLRASGGTAGQTGTAWGWYTISPNWANLWPDDSTPTAYDEDDILKFAIIMTDGDNNRHYDYKEVCDWRRVGHYWEYQCWYDWDRDYDSGYYGDSSERARQICENMKDEGITIYGIYFGTNNSSTGARNMQSCATDEDTTYYQATSSTELISAFGNIARKIQAIYLAR
jgi:Flp pilus assembly protein TadG